MSRRDLLVEFGTEELPPLALQDLADAFLGGIVRGLESAHLRHGRTQRYATPRRLAVYVKGLAEQQPEQHIKRRGPPVTAAFDAAGAPTRAAVAFAESCGTSVESLERTQEAKGEFLFFSGRKPGALTRDLIIGIVQASLEALPIPRRMRWGAGEVEFVRPVHWVLLLFGKEVLPGRLLGVETGGVTFGHRFHAPKPMRVSSPGSYVGALRKRGFVLADFAERRAKVRVDVAAVAGAQGGQAVLSDALLDEVTALVEWPVAIAGHFEARFLELPREVLIATLQDHQRYFPVQTNAAAAAGDATLLAQFVAVANIESRDPGQVRAGNERVVRPRLADAAFFYDLDRKQPLAARIEGLSKVTFQTRLGSLGDKTQRVRVLAGEIANRIGADRARTERAAELCKADLLTAMVGEFPELQGTMGRYYALHDAEHAEVAAAIAEHYWPRFAGDALPETRAGMAVAIADKIDTIVGIFAIDRKPSGTRDPFGVRRAALGVLRILIEKRVDLDLRQLIAEVPGCLQQWSTDVRTVAPTVNDDVYDYMMERLRAYYLDGAGGFSVTTEMFDAVLANRPASPLDFDARLRALSAFLSLDDSASLAAANKRIANILRKAEGAQAASINVELLSAEAEKRLHGALERLRPQVEPLLDRRSYGDAMQKLASLRAPVDAFFDSVMVMDPDAALRANRLALLHELRRLFLRTADLSRLPG